MRMIDADALDKMLADAQTECKKNGGNFRVGVLSNVRENIANAPTIDAIPVEWLRRQGKRGSIIQSSATTLIEKWQKEQEAQDG